MCKNVILNTAINAALDLPRTGLWASAAVAVVFSLDAGLAIVGDTLDLKAVGTTQVHAAPGYLTGQNTANGAFALGAAGNINGVTIGAVYTIGNIDGVAGFTGNLVGGNPVAYASEVFKATPTVDIIPDHSQSSSEFQAICYQVPGTIDQGFTIDFNLAGGVEFAANTATNTNWAFGLGFNLGDGSANCTQATPTHSATKMSLKVPSVATCSLSDGAQICLVYKLTKTSVLKDPGKTVEISAQLKSGTSTVGLGAAVPVAKSEQGAKFSLLPESDAQGEVFIASSTGNKEFTSTTGISDTDNTSTTEDWMTPFRASNEVQIGYIKYDAGSAVGRDGSNAFQLGGTDTATLVIENGQFSASPGGSSAGKVYLGTNANANTVENVGGKWTATWNLDGTQLAALTASSPKLTPILVRVDGLTTIDSGVDDDPVGTLDVKLSGTTSISDQPITSSLRRIPYDGKVCTAYNIPTPTGGKDTLTLRITNDSEQVGTITGTLYNEAGEVLGENVDLLAGHVDYTKNPPVDRATLGLADPLQLQKRETVILTSQNIATAFGQTEWPGERYVLQIRSTIPRIEVFNLLRNTETAVQPLSNVSTSAKGVECSPIP